MHSNTQCPIMCFFFWGGVGIEIKIGGKTCSLLGLNSSFHIISPWQPAKPGSGPAAACPDPVF